ncbi:signal recognition particle protein [Zymomonas mobilis subsp. mobilis ZM4 = ATCC 31821]|uniref:Signal recognition particle protein n=2 Tax=Zymomonas mobilis subsp. mobilis TaxID=120045 RepID=Q5NNL1_ZYMMO|nr:signal recognition particle protein [Zymomonas mobilis]AAV89699.1 signal recognition particle protein [Zymomonas mobilis subsp. mobilis ZM4 = ATCC 31821]ACV74793.1 signal recognition particle protein [Zymomonas mobilis subsp. mobilis NCIMB 11163]AEH62096.1 signal recognition particle protein [Zymomonas mobilis subsp. mobilis ATCC 10988]AFN56149.1 signal recognition particle protein [Zymomonas mobilis subsp. mobilis ATCC 29191]AHB09581.1 signal recognition particle subunit FFH/SRP54 (srp54) 
MFGSLSERLSGVFDRLRGRGALTEDDVRQAMREVRIALLEADVALPVVRDFVSKITEKAIGHNVLKSVTPGQQVVKIVYDALVEMLGSDTSDLNLAVNPPAVILMVGLQGSGKTTTSAKLGKKLKEKDHKKVLMASLDVHRPAAQEQLATLGQQADVPTLPIIAGQQPVEIAQRALTSARLQGYDVVILDTAGRLHIDQLLMDEMKAVADSSQPAETLLVVDALAGQDAVNIARSFSEQVDLTGVILTRMDGDARGGAALSMRAVTGKPIKFVGTSEKLDGLSPFHPDRVANRILGMGDIISLVEKASETIEKEDAEALAAKMAKGRFDFNDLKKQFSQMRRMGGMGALASMLPGVKQIKNAMANGQVDDRILVKMEAMIDSMTPKERIRPELINAKRKIRIAKGSGTTVQEINRLLKMHQEMSSAMKRLKKLGGIKGLMKMLGGGADGGMPPMMPPGGGMPGLPPGFGGFGRK